MTLRLQRFWFPASVLVLGCFAVFYLPFLLPPPVLAGVSAANAAGFNNKLSALAAAVLGVVVFTGRLYWPSRTTIGEPIDEAPLSLSFLVLVAGVTAAVIALLCWLLALSHARYVGDAGYFIEQVGAHVEFGRKLYDQIEFPYGPLIFYGPIVVRAAFFPLHLSITGAYLFTLVLENFVGLLMVGYVINNLPMLRRWKILLLLMCAPAAVEPNLGLNYTFFRFATPAAMIVLTTRQRSPLKAAICLFAGQAVSLGISPEMGFAFAASGTFYATYRFFEAGKAWLIGIAAPVVATLAFLLATGGGYFRMLKLFAHGVFNFIVEPLPHILVFLFAVIWLVPGMLALYFRERRPATALLASLYILVVTLLPVALGRADPGHVFFNGFILLLVSMVAISSWRPRRQILWAACVGGSFLWAAYIDTLPSVLEIRSIIHYDVLHYGSDSLKQAAYRFTRLISPSAARHYMTATFEADETFDLHKLQSIVGNAKVATPDLIPLVVENDLKSSGQYTPSFYCFHTAVLDAAAEGREIKQFNQSSWALLPEQSGFRIYETAEGSAGVLGFRLPYRTKRTPYVTGILFDLNLQRNWELYARFDGYKVYKRKERISEQK